MSSSTAPAYPKRPAFFNIRFLRMLADVSAAGTVGADGCWLLAVIVGQEDAVRYRRPVDFFNGQLMERAGLRSVDTLARVRERLVKAGWLHYEQRAKRLPGLYWVQVPEEHRGAFERMGGFEGFDSAVDSAPVRSEQANTPHGCGDKPADYPHGCGSSAEPPALFPKDTQESAAPRLARSRTTGGKTPATGKPKAEKPPAAHPAAVAVWCDLWGAKYGKTYSFAGGKDGDAVRWMLAELGGDVERFRATVARYLADPDNWLTRNEHPLLTLRSQFNKHKPAERPARSPPVPTTQLPDY